MNAGRSNKTTSYFGRDGLSVGEDPKYRRTYIELIIVIFLSCRPFNKKNKADGLLY